MGCLTAPSSTPAPSGRPGNTSVEPRAPIDVVTPPGDTPNWTGAVDGAACDVLVEVEGPACLADEQPASRRADAATTDTMTEPGQQRTPQLYARILGVIGLIGFVECSCGLAAPTPYSVHPSRP